MASIAPPVVTVPEIIPETAFVPRKRINVQDTILGVLFVAPATFITLLFGLYPVVYGFFVSLQAGRLNPNGFVGLQNYVQALGSVAYLFSFGIGWACLWGGYQVWRGAYKAMIAGKGNFRLYLIPAAIAAPAVLLIGGLAFVGDSDALIFPIMAIIVALAIYILINRRMPSHTPLIGYILRSWGTMLLILSGLGLILFTFQQIAANTAGTFSLLQPLFDDAGLYLPQMDDQFVLLGLLTIAVLIAFGLRLLRQESIRRDRTVPAAILLLLTWICWLAVGIVLIALLGHADQLRIASLSFDQLDQTKFNAALASLGVGATADQLIRDLLTWPQVFAILLGTTLILLAYLTWQNATRRETTPAMITMILLAIMLAIGGWLLIGELPSAIANGDPVFSPDFYNSLLRTATYSFVAVPCEIGLGLLMAYLLFYEVTIGKGLYRLIFFIPYIAPTIATAAVFTALFTLSPDGAINQILHFFGIPAQQWLRTPQGVFQVIAHIINPNAELPDWLGGPSLPLTTVLIFSIWVFSGYNAVIFMAGLGAVPRELYEAAEVDGAGRWTSFRKITLPMISPTTFFLTMLAIIGTFQAFTHIYIMRQNSARGAMDTTTVVIYDAIRNGLLPYASATAFILFALILILTLIQNRVTKDQVFYG